MAAWRSWDGRFEVFWRALMFDDENEFLFSVGGGN